MVSIVNSKEREDPEVILSDISGFITKGATPTTYGFNWQSSGIPFLRSECVSSAGLDLRQSKFISAGANKALRRSQVNDGDILMTITGNVGRVVRLSNLGPANINQHIARIRVGDERFDPGYVFHYLSQPHIRAFFESITTGQAYPQISLVQVRQTRISAISFEQQREIAKYLDDCDLLIDSLDRLIAKKQAIKQGLMQQLLTGKIRLPGFTSSWRDTRLGEVLRFQAGFPFPSQNFTEAPSGPRLVRNRDLRSNDSVIYYAGAFSRDFVLSPGDVIIGMDGDFEPHVWMHEGALLNQRVGRLRATGSVSLSYLAYALLLPLKNLESVTGATTVKHLSHLDVENIVLSLPEKSEQEQISAVLIDADAEISCLYRQLEGARNIKQGMMQELLTGRTRLTPTGE